MRLQNTSKIGWLLTPPGYLPLLPKPRHLSLNLCSDPISAYLLPHNPSSTRSCSNINQITLLCFRLSKDFLKVVKRPLRSFVICHCPLPTHHLFLWFLSPTISPSLTPFQPSCLLTGLHPLRTPALVFVLTGILFQDSYLALSPLSLFKCHVLRGTSPTTLFKITNLLFRAPWHPNPLPNLIFFHSTYPPLACHII